MAASYQRAGIFHEGNGHCECRVWAPFMEKVQLELHGDNAISRSDMEKDDRGYWSVHLQNTYPGTRYTFRLNESVSYPDPASLLQPEGVFGPSVIAGRSFKWTDKDWKGIEPGQMIIYELHTGTFTPESNFNGIAGKLDYLKELGITTIELMPVAQFPGTKSWGYDGVFPFAVQNSYGGMDALKSLVNTAHEKGIAVVLDVVYNHLGPEGNVLEQFGPYFTDKYKTPWGKAVNLDDAWSFGVRNYIIQNALMWLEEFHIDGLRVDAVHALYDNSAKHIVAELGERVRALEQHTGKRKILIAEFDLNSPRHINPADKGGHGWDAQWIDEFHHALHAVLTGETNGYYEDFGQLTQLHKALSDSYVFTGQYSVHRKKDFGVPVDNDYHQFVVFAQNHDHIGNRLFGERLTTLLVPEALKLAAATILLSPYIPLLFMGEEYGEKNPFQFFAGYSGKDLVEMVRQGRKSEFGYFGWEQEPPDPFAPETFNNSRLSWNIHGEQESSLLQFYRHLIHFRKTSGALRQRERNSMKVHPLNGRPILCFERWNFDEHLMVVLNFSNLPQSYSVEAGNWEKILDSSDRQWKGPGASASFILNDGTPAALNAFAALVFKKIVS